MNTSRIAALVLLASGTACVVPSSAVPNFPGQESAQVVKAPGPGWRAAAPDPNQGSKQAGANGSSDGEPVGMAGEPDTPLYARDGSVVQTVPGGSTEERDVFAHEMEPTSTGRMYILELYQNALDEIDALETELSNLGTDYASLDAQLQSTQAELASVVAQAAASRGEADSLLTENGDLAARLTTAQIRRLEAERMLLEAKLELLNLGERVNSPTASAETKIPPSVAVGGETGGQ